MNSEKRTHITELVFLRHSSTFAKLLEKSRSVPIHIRNLQILATEILKVAKKHCSWYTKFILSSTKNLGFSSKGDHGVVKLKCL